MTTPRASDATIAAMPTTFHQMPLVQDPRPQPVSTGQAMGWLAVLFGLTWGRLAIIGFWIFSDLLGDAYDGWVVPVLGFVLLPWTTMSYAIAWGMSSNAVSGWEWLIVAFGALVDVLTWVGVRALR